MKKFRLPALFLLTLFILNGCAKAPRTLSTTSAFPSATTAYGVYHTVSRGETLYRISKQYHVDLGELMRVNRINSPSQLATGQRLYIPGIAPPVEVQPTYLATVSQSVRNLVGPKDPTSDWRTITVHHSATTKGSGKLFDRDHRRRHMGGLFYHFVIGNGTNTKDGEIEVGFRWKKQVKANRPYDIQICLVGNFDKQSVSDAQFDALADLISVLKEQCSIPMSSIRKHCDIKGKHTDCPGKKFPFNRLMSRLANGSR